MVPVPTSLADDRHDVGLAATRSRWVEVPFVAGLAGLFLVNAATALVEPGDFVELFERSAVARWTGVEHAPWAGTVIAANDLVIGMALLATLLVRRLQPAVLAWAGIWLLVVTVTRMTALDAFPG